MSLFQVKFTTGGVEVLSDRAGCGEIT
jgi:hypothetical protein